MNVVTLRLNTWSKARVLADQLSGWTFRGQQDASWPLSTTLQRAGQQGQQTSILLTSVEQQITEEFQRPAHHFFPDPPALEHLIEWLALIQHFGGPTRLLDFTRSFYVAAFFAVERASAESAVWCVNNYALFNAVGPLLGLDMKKSHIPYWQVSHRMAAVAETTLKKNQHYLYNLGDQQHQLSNFSDFTFEVQPFRLNERLAVQQGLFLCPLSVDVPFMHSHAASFGLPPSAFTDTEAKEYEPSNDKKWVDEVAVIKLLLPLAIHHDVLQDLWNMNVTAATLFPGLDGFARSLHYFLRIDNLWHIKFQSEYRSGVFGGAKTAKPNNSI